MASTITNAFITQFESEVHMAYQRMGAKLKNLVRTVNGVSGSMDAGSSAIAADAPIASLTRVIAKASGSVVDMEIFVAST